VLAKVNVACPSDRSTYQPDSSRAANLLAAEIEDRTTAQTSSTYRNGLSRDAGAVARGTRPNLA
jgi:hypothetical protein